MFYDISTASSPQMETFPQNITSLDGKDVTFSCAALGAPLPNVTWIFNGNHICKLANLFIKANLVLKIIRFKRN